MSASELHRAKIQKLDTELTWNGPKAATTPIYFPDVPGEIDRLTEKHNWVRAMAVITAAQHISEYELQMLCKFEMVKWLGCEFKESSC